MKKFPIHPCAAKAMPGDQLEVLTPGGLERYPVVGYFKLVNENETVPVLGVCGGKDIYLDNYYFNNVVIDGTAQITEPYCLPIHPKYISSDSIRKVIRKTYAS